MDSTSPSLLTKDIVYRRHTGCLRSTNEKVGSRAALLLFEGRVVGCVFGSREQGDPQPTEPSLVLVLSQLALPETQVQLYELPATIILPMSAIFLGKQMHRSDDLDTSSYLEYMLSWHAQREQTACVTLTPVPGEAVLVFICRGQFSGSFQVQSQVYRKDIETVYEIIKASRSCMASASMLTQDPLTAQEPLGFSLE